MSDKAIVELKEVTRTHVQGEVEVRALRGVSLTFEPGELRDPPGGRAGGGRRAHMTPGDPLRLLRWHARDPAAEIAGVAAHVALARRRIEERVGSLAGATVVDLGCGQRVLRGRLLGPDVRLVAVDTEVIGGGWRLLRSSPARVVKTVGRRALGFDRRYRRALARQLGRPELGAVEVVQTPADRIALDDGVADALVSFCTLEHVAEPVRFVRECRRVVRPGGAVYLSVHPWSSDSGAHDPRSFRQHRASVPWWAHLRPEHAGSVRPSAPLNRWSTEAWRVLFAAELPGGTVFAHRWSAARAAPVLARLRRGDELADHADDALLTESLDVVWQG